MKSKLSACLSVGRFIPSLVGLVVLGLVVGCGGRPTTTVEGKVTLDGAPVEKGSIRFVPSDGAAPGGGEIKDGRYSVKVATGEAKVEITSPKVVDKKKMYDTPDSPMIDVTKESIPEKYNAKSELKYKVERGTNTKDFDLKSK
jgi:hypothetical protein